MLAKPKNYRRVGDRGWIRSYLWDFYICFTSYLPIYWYRTVASPIYKKALRALSSAFWALAFQKFSPRKALPKALPLAPQKRSESPLKALRKRSESAPKVLHKSSRKRSIWVHESAPESPRKRSYKKALRALSSSLQRALQRALRGLDGDFTEYERSRKRSFECTHEKALP